MKLAQVVKTPDGEESYMILAGEFEAWMRCAPQ